MREIGLTLFFLLRALCLDIKSSGFLAYRLLRPLIIGAGRQPLTWFVLVLGVIGYLAITPIIQQWDDRATGRSFLALLILYPVAEMLGKSVSTDITTLSVKRHLAWLAEIDDVVHEFNVIRSLNAKELREFSGDFTLAEIQMRMADSQDRMVGAMSNMAANLPAGEADQAQAVPLLDIPALTNTVLLIIWGTQGGGKTTLAKMILRYREQQGHSITIADPHGSIQEWGDWQLIGMGRDYDRLNAYLKQFDDDVTADYQQYSQGKRNFAYKTLLADEFTQWADRCTHSASFVKSACSDLRKIRRCVVLITHADTITGLGKAVGLRDAIDRSAVKLQLETRLTKSGEYEPTGYGVIQYPGQEKQRVRIPPAADFTLPAATAPPVELQSSELEAELIDYFSQDEPEQIDIDALTEEQINDLIDRKRSNKPKNPSGYSPELKQKFLLYFREKAVRYADREGWVSVSRLQQHWGKPNGLAAEQFRSFLGELTNLEVGKFHPEDPDFWTMTE
jgi:hypothetical protein